MIVNFHATNPPAGGSSWYDCIAGGGGGESFAKNESTSSMSSTSKTMTSTTTSSGVLEQNLNPDNSSSPPNDDDEHDGRGVMVDSAYLWNGENIYLETAKSLVPVTDKVTTHTYQIMYGKFLLPYYHQHPHMKMLEIGLGCDMDYGPGASVNLYKKLFPKAELWEAEYNAACVKKHMEDGMISDIHVLIGDQGNDEVLDGWIEQSGGQFDVVIDDGGHHNCMIWNSFRKLWPTVKSGGLYFIEDMQVAKARAYMTYETSSCSNDLIVPEKLKEIVDNLMYDIKRKSDVNFIFCQSEACVLGKK